MFRNYVAFKTLYFSNKYIFKHNYTKICYDIKCTESLNYNGQSYVIYKSWQWFQRCYLIYILPYVQAGKETHALSCRVIHINFSLVSHLNHDKYELLRYIDIWVFPSIDRALNIFKRRTEKKIQNYDRFFWKRFIITS